MLQNSALMSHVILSALRTFLSHPASYFSCFSRFPCCWRPSLMWRLTPSGFREAFCFCPDLQPNGLELLEVEMSPSSQLRGDNAGNKEVVLLFFSAGFRTEVNLQLRNLHAALLLSTGQTAALQPRASWKRS